MTAERPAAAEVKTLPAASVYAMSGRVIKKFTGKPLRALAMDPTSQLPRSAFAAPLKPAVGMA